MSLRLPRLLVSSQFLHTVSLSTHQCLLLESSTRPFISHPCKKNQLQRPTQAKAIPRTAKCAQPNIQNSCRQKGKNIQLPSKPYDPGPVITDAMSLKLLQIQPCSKDCHSQYPLEAWGHPTTQQTHISGPEGDGFSADNIQHWQGDWQSSQAVLELAAKSIKHKWLSVGFPKHAVMQHVSVLWAYCPTHSSQAKEACNHISAYPGNPEPRKAVLCWKPRTWAEG